MFFLGIFFRFVLVQLGIEILRLIRTDAGTEDFYTDKVEKDFFKRHTVLFVHGEKERREHEKHHARCGITRSEKSPCEEVKRNTDCSGNPDANELPFCQIKKDFRFDTVQVLWYGYISQSLTPP